MPTVKELKAKAQGLEQQIRSVIEAAGDNGLSSEDHAKVQEMHRESGELLNQIDAQQKVDELAKRGVGTGDVEVVSEEETRSIVRDLGIDMTPEQNGFRDVPQGAVKPKDQSLSRSDYHLALRAWAIGSRGIDKLERNTGKDCRALMSQAGIAGQDELFLPFAKRNDCLGSPEAYPPLEYSPAGICRPRNVRDINQFYIDAVQQRQQSTAPGGGLGGETVPDEMMRPLESEMVAFGGMRTMSRVVRTSTGAPMPWPTDADASNNAATIVGSRLGRVYAGYVDQCVRRNRSPAWNQARPRS